jgi:flagellar protein FliS
MFLHRSQAGQSYRQVAAQTASPGHLVLMLFDGAIRFLERALAGFEENDPLQFHQTIHNNVTRAQAILRELDLSLDLERGGEFAGTMRRLYDYFDHCLYESNRQKSDHGIREVLRHLAILRDAWAEMLHQSGAPAAREAPAEAPALATLG